MSQAVEQLLQAALALPDDEQAQLVGALHAAMDERRIVPCDAEWMAEVDRRSAEYDAGAIPTYSWAEVKERARRKFESNSMGKRLM